MKRKRDLSIDILKLLTVLLIINSHSDILYPPKIKFLASGGVLVNIPARGNRESGGMETVIPAYWKPAFR